MANLLLAIDGNSLMHRAYWALPEMQSEDGTPTNAIYGFFTMLFKIVEEHSPTHIAVAFDRPEKTFRHEAYDEYKAGRKKTPDELHIQLKLIKDALSIVGIKCVEQAGYEADDILGALTKNANMPAYIFTGDKDELQLITSLVNVVLTKKGVSETRIMTVEQLKEDLGLAPNQIPDLKGLMGDASDNIPGVRGVGEKTALKLLAQFGTVENLYENIEELPKNKMYEKLVDGKKFAFMSKKLATIDINMPLNAEISDFSFNGFSNADLEKMFIKYSFKNFLKRFNLEQNSQEEEVSAVIPTVITTDKLNIIENADEFSCLVLSDGVHVAVNSTEEYVLPIKQTLIDDGYDISEIILALKPYFNTKKVILHDAKAFLHTYDYYDINIIDFYDTMLAAWVIYPSYSKYTIDEVSKRAGLTLGAYSLFLLKENQQNDLEQNELLNIYENIEKPLLRLLFRMEKSGVLVSKEELAALGKDYDEQLTVLTKNIYELAGAEFNIGSPKQLAEILFERLGLPVIKKTKTGYSTDAEVLEKLYDKHPSWNIVL